MNPFKLLGVHLRSSDAEICDAYYELARKYHPDTGFKNDIKFVQVATAYRQIKDTRARREFFRPFVNKDCKECKGGGVIAKSKCLTKKEYTACKGCGGAGVIIKEDENESTIIRGIDGACGKGSDNKRGPRKH